MSPTSYISPKQNEKENIKSKEIIQNYIKKGWLKEAWWENSQHFMSKLETLTYSSQKFDILGPVQTQASTHLSKVVLSLW